MNEQDWDLGYRAGLVLVLQTCLKHLGYEDLGKIRDILHREQTIATLRRICERHGDNDWPDDLHLSDVLEKHLEPYLT